MSLSEYTVTLNASTAQASYPQSQEIAAFGNIVANLGTVGFGLEYRGSFVDLSPGDVIRFPNDFGDDEKVRIHANREDRIREYNSTRNYRVLIGKGDFTKGGGGAVSINGGVSVYPRPNATFDVNVVNQPDNPFFFNPELRFAGWTGQNQKTSTHYLGFESYVQTSAATGRLRNYDLVIHSAKLLVEGNAGPVFFYCAKFDIDVSAQPYPRKRGTPLNRRLGQVENYARPNLHSYSNVTLNSARALKDFPHKLIPLGYVNEAGELTKPLNMISPIGHDDNVLAFFSMSHGAGSIPDQIGNNTVPNVGSCPILIDYSLFPAGTFIKHINGWGPNYHVAP